MWFEILKIDTEGLPPGLQKIIDEYEIIKPDDTRTPFEKSWDLARNIARKIDITTIVGDEVHMRPPWLLKWLRISHPEKYKPIMSGEINNFYLSFDLDTDEFCVYINLVYAKKMDPATSDTKPKPSKYKSKICLHAGPLPMGDNFATVMLTANSGFDNWRKMW